MIGNAERALELMVSRVKSRVAFGGPLVSQVFFILNYLYLGHHNLFLCKVSRKKKINCYDKEKNSIDGVLLKKLCNYITLTDCFYFCSVFKVSFALCYLHSQKWLLPVKMEILALDFKHSALFDYTTFITKNDVFEFRIQ